MPTTFIYLDVGTYGADSDDGIFRECGLYQALEQDEAGPPLSEPLPGGDTDVPFLVVDDVFALRSWMMKPHAEREMTAAERIFNYMLFRTRRIVENAFGTLTNRYRSVQEKNSFFAFRRGTPLARNNFFRGEK